MGNTRVKPQDTRRPVWSLVGNTNGIKTKELSLQPGDAVTMWLETDLTQSMIEVQKG